MDTMDSQRRVFITGISSGLGFALAQVYLQMGWKVYGVSRHYPDGLQGNDNLYYQSLDLADLKYIPTVLQSLFSHVSMLDLVILNAGILAPIADMKDTSLDDIHYVMDVNVWSNKVILDALATKPIEVRQVIAISSGAGVTGHRGWNAYAVSKAALNMLMQLYATENPQIHFTALAPGIVDTPMQEYISSLTEVTQFPTMQRLQQARGTQAMPSADVVADRLVRTIPKLLSNPSGSYADIRKLT